MAKLVGLCKQVPVSSVFSFSDSVVCTIHFCESPLHHFSCYLLAFIEIPMASHGNWKITHFSENSLKMADISCKQERTTESKVVFN